MSRNLIIIAAVAVVLVGGAVMFLGGQKSNPSPSTSVPTETVKEQPSPTEVMQKEEAAVSIANFAFSPKTITIKKGTTVVFTNQDSVSHTATADGGSFDTGLLAKGESGFVTFDKAGTFTYHCTPHPYMKATIVVE